MKSDKVFRIYCFCALLLFLVPVIKADDPYNPVQPNPLFESWRWKTFSELSDKGVRCYVEGDNNTIWFGTGKGVFYYDGLDFQNFHNENEILSSPIYGLCLTNKNVLYVVSLKGICHFSDGLWVTDFLFPPENVLGSEWEILNITQTSNGDIWVPLYFGLLRIKNQKTDLFTDRGRVAGMDPYLENTKTEYLENTSVDMNHVIVYDIIEDSNGNTWLALEDGRIVKIDGQFLDISSFRSYTLFDENSGMISGRLPVLFETSNGTVMTISQSVLGGVNSFNPYDNTWTSFKLSDEFGGDNLNYSILETNDGTIWIGGLARLFTYKDELWHEYRQPELNIPQTRILLLTTRDGSLWISGLLSDVFRIEYKSSYWNTYKGLNYECETGDGKKWFLSSEGKVVIQNEISNVWMVLDTAEFPMDSPVRLFKDRSGALWGIGSHENQATLVFNHAGYWQRRLFPDLCWGIHPNGVSQGTDNMIWFGANADCGDTQWGLLRYDPSKGSPLSDAAWHHFPGTDICEVAYSLGQTEYNTLLCGYYKGLFEYNGQSSSELHTELLNDIVKVESMDQDLNRGVWIGTRSRGIIHYINTDEWKQYTIEDGLASNTISNILVASDSTVWAVTDKGISRFDGEKWLKIALPEFFKISRGNGSIRQSSDGSIWINANSIEWYRRVYFNTNYNEENSPLIVYKIDPENQPPETNIIKYDKKVYYPNNSLIFWKGRDPWNQSSEDELQFSFKLDEEEWSDYSSEMNHNFLSLKRGKHKLSVRARDKYFNVDPTPATIEFKAIPPVWAQIWFIFLMIGFVSTIAYLFIITMRKNKEVRTQNREMAKKNEDLIAQQKEIEENEKKIMDLLDVERQIKWHNEGIVHMGDVIKKNKDDEKRLAQEIVTNLVHYIDVQYGGFFLYRKEEDDEYLELIANYGFDNKRVEKKKILCNEGLTGTCFTEKRIMVVDNLPEDFMLVSGLGGAKLHCLILMPLKHHGEVAGVLEIASFNTIEERVVKLLETVSENIAANILGFEAKRKIEIMYSDSQQQTAKLHEQEEEMRQQMEELNATQEESQRREQELLKTIEEYKIKEKKNKKNRDK